MIKAYETAVVFDGSLPDDVLAAQQQKIEQFLAQNGTFEKTDVWGKQQLAYELKGKRLGFYCIFLYKGESGTSDKLEHDFDLNTAILRFLSLVRDESKVVLPFDIDASKLAQASQSSMEGEDSDE